MKTLLTVVTIYMVVTQHANELNVNVNNKLMSIIGLLINCHMTLLQGQGLCGVLQLLFVIFPTFGILHIRLFRALTRSH